jgi:hypothetical protein
MEQLHDFLRQRREALTSVKESGRFQGQGG